MAATSAEVLQEYLVSVGYDVDPVSYKKLTTRLADVQKKVVGVEGATSKAKVAMSGLGWAAAAGAVALGFSTAMFATQMRKVYASSELAGASVNNMKSLEKAGESVGISAEALGNSVRDLSNKIRSNPGMQQWVESLGVKVTGRDASDVALDILGVLKQMPQFVGQQYAESMLGMDRETYFLTIKYLDEIKAKKLEIAKMLDATTDPERAKEVTKHYAAMVDKLEARFSAFWDSSLRAGIPAFDFFATQSDHILEAWTDWAQIISGEKKWSDFFGEGAGKKQPFANNVSLTGYQTAEEKAREKAFNDRLAKSHPLLAGGTVSPQGKAGGASSDQKAYLDKLTKEYGLEQGLLYGIWGAESRFGDPRFMKSKKGAQGHFQLMPETAQQYGVADPNDFYDAAAGAAKMLADLTKKYQGDMPKVLAAYNWGQGNVDRKGLARMPAETADYIPRVASMAGWRAPSSQGSGSSVAFAPVTNITITGNVDAATKQTLEDVVANAHSTTLRNMKTIFAGA